MLYFLSWPIQGPAVSLGDGAWGQQVSSWEDRDHSIVLFQERVRLPELWVRLGAQPSHLNWGYGGCCPGRDSWARNPIP